MRSFLLLVLLGLAVPLGANSLSQDPENPISPRAQRFFERTLLDAKKGDSKAMGILGLLYEKGEGTAKDLDQAFQWSKKGAQKGDAAAQNNLGFLYFRGLGVKEDDAEALRRFRKAAAQGLASAQANLGLMFARGTSVPKDYALALEWFQKAADQGDMEAQVNLAQMFSLGQGAPKDLVASYQWFTLALKHSRLDKAKLEELRDDLQWLEKRMTGAQVAEAKKKAQEWRESHTAEVSDTPGSE